MAMRVVLYSTEMKGWVAYTRPRHVWRAHEPGRIPHILSELEENVESRGLHGAGFLSYEAGPAFDPAMPGQNADRFPLAWFGLFDPPEPVALVPDPCPAEMTWTAELDASAHAGALGRIREYLSQGETYQVNFTYRLRTPFAGDAWNLFCDLISRQPSPHGAYVDLGDFAICCLSPEAFFERSGQDVWSRPMKGTCARGRWLDEDCAQAEALRRCEKNRAENVMIVDMVRNDLGRICLPGSVHAPELFRVERYPTLWQMTSLVRGRTDRTTADVLAALFPAASITGAPKVRTMEIIQELEPSPRRIYTGSIGVLMPGRRARFNVAIRTVLVDRDRGQAEYGVGGGIVWDSQPEAEYLESRLKARVLTTRPDEFSLIETMRWTRDAGIHLRETHLRRLRAGAEYFGFVFDESECLLLLEKLTAEMDCDAVVRLTLDRNGRIELSRRDLPTAATCRLRLAAEPVHSRDVFLFHKTTRRTIYEKAARDVGDGFEPLLWNERGEVTEGAIATVVVEWQGQLLTPALHCGLLPGVLRAHLLETGRVREAVITVAELAQVTRIWLISAVRGWRTAKLHGPEDNLDRA